MLVQYAYIQHGAGYTFFYIFFLNIPPAPHMHSHKVYMLNSTPSSNKSGWFKSGDPLAHVPQLFSGASVEKLSVVTGWGAPWSTPIMDLGHVWVVAPEQRAGKAHPCPTMWSTPAKKLSTALVLLES